MPVAPVGRSSVSLSSQKTVALAALVDVMSLAYFFLLSGDWRTVYLVGFALNASVRQDAVFCFTLPV